jgi:hypothetical protein
MFSIKPINNDDSRSFAIILDKENNKVLETIYYTELSREIDSTNNDFAHDIFKYCKTFNSNTQEFKLDSSKYYFEMACHNKRTTKFQRFLKLYIAPSNSGKSYNLSKLCYRHKQAFPDDKIIYGSVHDINNDKSFEKTKSFINQLDVTKQNAIINVEDEELRGSLIIFDDLDSNSGSITIENLGYTQDDYNKLSANDQAKITKLLKSKMQTTSHFIDESMKNIIFNARKYQISMCYVFHAFNNGRKENLLLNEVSSVVLFPYNSSKSVLNKWLINKIHLSKEDAKFITDYKWYQYDFLELNISSGQKI